MEVPPSIEAQQIVSIFFTLPSYQYNPSLLKDDSSLLAFPGCWLATCNYDLRDPGHHTNEGSCREALGAVPDDRITDRLPKDREGMWPCNFYRSMEDENELCVLEEWDTRENLNSYLKS